MVPSVDAGPSRPGSSRHGQAARETKPYPWRPHFHKINIAMIMRQMAIACKRIRSGMVQAEPDDLGGARVPYAISYRRFSTPRQARGDSQRRQTDLTEEYCKRRRLRLIDTYLDAGLSGYTGENLNDGSALRSLLAAAKSGRFKSGTHLIVESLDRLSRREISTAIRLFLDILDCGFVIVTLIDGEEVFTKKRVDNDLTALIIAIVYLARANNESPNRSERG